jgi:Rieske Fe-S protein
MSEKTDNTEPAIPAQENERDNGRRKFLLIFPIGVFGAIAGVMTAAAWRFLRPMGAAKQEEKWLDVGPVADLKGDKPIIRSVMTERTDGWATTFEEQSIIVVPKQDHQAYSTVCPHEGCAVVWRDESNDFFCPCHDSLFSADGAWVAGPSRRGLDPLPSRHKDGVLQVQHHNFINNTEERTPRA